ncbi:hypothetical protein BGZ99_009734 [Dissophora globulifera]|uniref:Oxysterol-binding protein n=1 Tax=Dissophora globulifera TaxID=979702 RepID=A0A9P6R6H6_9FUNG|nr:hypothetical protein BGZ99_009734 [Dissophora globulifera]
MADPNKTLALEGDDTEEVDEGNRSILMDIISQLSKGGDLHRVTLPTFVLEPRSMLERITDFMSHPEILFKANHLEDPVERFVAITRYFLSGWHIKPKGVKKPYNPILGEHFRTKWTFDDGTEAFFVGEQVSHHPPISVYYYASPENNVSIVGDLLPKSKFLGNSAATLMQGEIKVSLTNRPGEDYMITMPNVYARGILFGTMLMELGDAACVKCPELDLICTLEFKVKGYFTGTYNSIGGKIKRISTGEVLYDISGKWSDEIYITKRGIRETLFDAKTAKIQPKTLAPEDKQEPNESRRLWSKLTAALKVNNQSLATEEKSKVEDAQRARSKDREERGEVHVPRYFEPNSDDGFDIKLKNLSSDPQEAKKQIVDFIFNTPAPTA